MKKKISLLLVAAMLFALLPTNPATVSAADAEAASYLVLDFEDGTSGDVNGGSYSFVDGPGVSQSALYVTTTAYPTFDVALRRGYTQSSGTYSGYTYDISAWIKADSAPSSNNVQFVFTLENAEYDPNDNGTLYTKRPETVTETITISDAGLVAGEWVKVSTTYAYDGTTTGKYKSSLFASEVDYDYKTNPVGSMQIVVGGGVNYTIDDIVIMPQAFYCNQGQSSPDTVIGFYGFEDTTTIPTDGTTHNGYRVAHGTSEIKTVTTGEEEDAADGTSDGKIYVSGLTTEAVSGNYLTITSTNADGQLVYENADMRYGVNYQVFFMARAENDAAVGGKPQFVINRSNRTDKENITYNYYTSYPSSVTPKQVDADGNSVEDYCLTTNWRRYVINVKENAPSYDTDLPDISIKLTGDNVSGASWSIDNLKVYQVSGSTVDALNAEGSIQSVPTRDTTYRIDLTSGVGAGGITESITRVVAPYGDGEVIVKTFNNWKNEESFTVDESVVANGLKMRVNPKDRNEYYGSEFVAIAQMPKDHVLTAVAEFDQTVWAPDMPNLSATIRYNAPSGSETLKALCGMYDENNKMVSSDVKEFTLSAGEGEVSLSMNTVKEATTAKVFLWESGTLSPRKEDAAELTKTTDGNFIYVDPVNGMNNTYYGYSYPVKYFSNAVTGLAHLKKSNPADTYIILMPGYHQVTSTISIADTHTSDGYKVVVTSYNKNDKGVISGGTNLTGKFTEYENGIWRAPVTLGTQSRQLYVNGAKGVRARTEGRLEGFTNTTVYNSSGYLDTLGVITATDTSYKDFEHADDLEFIFYSLWTMGRCGVTSITENDDGTISFNMDELGFKNLSAKGNTRARTPAWIENAYELIDRGGEWYLDEEGDGTNAYLYYLPREGEDMTVAEVILPTFDNYFMADGPMINVSGTADAPAYNVEFNGVEFSHTTWTRPSTEYGHADAQNNHIRESYKTDAPTGDRLTDGAIDVTYADNIDFYNCDFTRMGITALRILDGADNCDVTGNEFFYISGSAVNIGEPYQGVYKADGTGTKTDEQYILDNINFTNNYIHHVAHDFWSAAAISAGHPRNSTIMHNEICNIPYSGMHIGYGWSSYPTSTMTLKIENNYIHDLFQGDIYDGGGIYTIGGTGGTAENPCTMRGNYIENIGPGAATLYNDQGSRYWLVENNVSDISDAWGEYDPTTGDYKGASNCMNVNQDTTDATRDNYLIWRNNYSSVNDVYIGSYAQKDDTTVSLEEPIGLDTSTGTWTAEAQAIIANAGIQEEYRSNFEFGLQTLTVAKAVNLSAGDSFANYPCFLTGKNTLYKSNALVVDVVSSNTEVATATTDTITAVGAGTAVITYTVLEGGIYRSVTTTVTVE